MLRGINIGGKKIVRMEHLRASFEALEFGRVRTYVQSGNVIFEAVRASPNDLSRTIAEKISEDFGFPIPVVVRTSDEMGRIVGGNPFLNERGLDPSKLHITFLAALPAKNAKERIDALNAGPDHFRIRGREIYVYCPDGYGRTKLSNNAIEKAMSAGATTSTR